MFRRFCLPLLVIVWCCWAKINTKKIQDCTGKLLLLGGKGGLITSLNYPSTPAEQLCEDWLIQSEPSSSHIITLSFQDLHIPPSDPSLGDTFIVEEGTYRRCVYDYLQLDDIRLCGSINLTDPFVYSRRKNSIKIKFRLHGKELFGRGFSLTYHIGTKLSGNERCSNGEFRCNDQHCISDSWKCNGVYECRDKSDEKSCGRAVHLTLPSMLKCGADRFFCNASRGGQPTCITYNNLCDGHSDCQGGQDESRAMCDAAQTCGEAYNDKNGSFTSPKFPSPYPGVQDCHWHISLPQHGSQHPKVQLRFHNFSIDPSHTANYLAVYDGGSVEDPLLGMFTSSEHSPPVTMEASSNVMFIHFHSEANHGFTGFNATYQTKGECLSDQYPCQHGEKDCFLLPQRCDDVWDCVLHGGDEKGCGQCSFDTFPCGNGKCYPESDRCNGATSRCSTKRDERNCSAQQCNAGNGTFLCDTMLCIYETWQCDGTDDCGDGSDEVNCSHLPSTKVITASVVGSLVFGLLVVVTLGCTCRLHALRTQAHSSHSSRHVSAVAAIQQQIWLRHSAPPPYAVAMVSSRPYEEVRQQVLEYVRQNQHSEGEDSGSGDHAGRSGHDRDTSPSTTSVTRSDSNLSGGSDVPLLPLTLADENDVPLLDAAGRVSSVNTSHVDPQETDMSCVGDMITSCPTSGTSVRSSNKEEVPHPRGDLQAGDTADTSDGDNASADQDSVILSVDKSRDNGGKHDDTSTELDDLSLVGSRFHISDLGERPDGHSLDSIGLDSQSDSTVNIDEL